MMKFLILVACFIGLSHQAIGPVNPNIPSGTRCSSMSGCPVGECCVTSVEKRGFLPGSGTYTQRTGQCLPCLSYLGK